MRFEGARCVDFTGEVGERNVDPTAAPEWVELADGDVSLCNHMIG